MLVRILLDTCTVRNHLHGLSNYPKTLSSPGFYGGYTPFSDSYLGGAQK